MRAATCTLLIWVSISFAQWTEPERIAPDMAAGWRQPWISNSGTRLYLSSMTDIYMSTRVNPWGWTTPAILPEHINNIGDVRSPCESPSGDTLYFTSWDFIEPNGWEVYYCVRTDSGWGPVVNAGPPVNTVDMEESVGISRDGSMLLVQSGFRIYYHEKQEDGTWGPPIDFGIGEGGIEDEHPSLSPDNSRLFFARRGANHGDIMESRKVDGFWQAPVPLPNPLINGTMTQELDPCFRNDGRTLIFRKGTPGENYLYSTVDTTVLDAFDIPAEINGFSLAVFPNPFNNTNTISLSIPSYDRDVEIAIINTLGQIVNRETVAAAGGMAYYVNDMSGFASGVYFVHVQAGEYAAAKKIVLMK
jgi:hypothetical protein